MTAKPSILTLDTLDDRRELHSLLHRLSPRRRVSFLAWCCRQVSGPNGTRPVASSRVGPTLEAAYRCSVADERLTNEMYGDVLALAAQWDLDLAAAARELEARVRRPGDRRPSSASTAS